MYQELFLAITCFAPYLQARNHSVLADPYLQIALKKALQQANVQESLVLLQLLAEFALMHKVYEQAESYIQQALELAHAHEQKESISALRTIRDTILLHNRDSVQAQANID
jgi:predicted ATPase